MFEFGFRIVHDGFGLAAGRDILDFVGFDDGFAASTAKSGVGRGVEGAL
jgi:hypothetical protein